MHKTRGIVLQQSVAVFCNVLPCVAVCSDASQFIAVCCSVLQSPNLLSIGLVRLYIGLF